MGVESVIHEPEIEGVKVGDSRWDRVYEKCYPNVRTKHFLTINKRGFITIWVKCPACGKWGRLLSNGSRSMGQGLIVKHGKKPCRLAPSKKFDEYVELYRLIRRSGFKKERKMIMRVMEGYHVVENC